MESRLTRLIWTAPAVMLATVLVPASLSGQDRIRIATFNVSLYGQTAGRVRQRLSDGQDPQAAKLAAIVQTIRPDILLVNEIDHDEGAVTAKLLGEKFFAVPQDGRQPIEFPYLYAPPSNTGIDSGSDLNNNGRRGEPADSWGFGRYSGQYAMAIYSRFPIDHTNLRTFQTFRWSQMPDAKQPRTAESGQPYYDSATWQRLRLSSKNHVDVPIVVNQRTIHILASHPTPPVFDGPEDRNGCRNHDEIRFWSDYLDPQQGAYIVDDRGRRGSLAADAAVVVMGDLNADCADGDGIRAAIQGLLEHPRLQDPAPRSLGGQAHNGDGSGEAALDTARFRGRSMRIDYVLPSRDLPIIDSGVFWPTTDSADHELISASDHSLVWVEVKLR